MRAASCSHRIASRLIALCCGHPGSVWSSIDGEILSTIDWWSEMSCGKWSPSADHVVRGLSSVTKDRLVKREWNLKRLRETCRLEVTVRFEAICDARQQGGVFRLRSVSLSPNWHSYIRALNGSVVDFHFKRQLKSWQKISERPSKGKRSGQRKDFDLRFTTVSVVTGHEYEWGLILRVSSRRRTSIGFQPCDLTTFRPSFN